MTTYSTSLTISSLNSATPTTVIQNITSADTVVVTISTSSSLFASWTVDSNTGCTVSGTIGNRGTDLTITPATGATSYAVNVSTSRYDAVNDTYVYRYGLISGTISGGADTTPDAFTFTDQTDVALNSTITSNTITISGINAASAISITGGTYSINGGAYTSSSGTITNGQTVSVQHTSSSSYSTATNTTLTIGGVSDTFTSTTLAFVTDTTPDAFTFTDQTSVALNSTVTSNTITISGINSASTISITGGTYSINGGAYTSATSTITNGQTVSVQHTSSSSYSTATNTTLTIGGVSDTFTSTTLAFVTDTTPDAFTFTDLTGVALNTVITSNSITVSGINAAASISVTGGTYSINGGAYTSTTGTVTNGQTVTVQHTSSSSPGTTVNTTLTIGGISDTFSTTTAGTDTTPDPFSFTDQTNVGLSTTITSNSITVSGINTTASISVTGGTYSINGGAYTSTTGTITNGQTVTVQHTSSASYNTITNTVLTIGGVSDTFTSTTLVSSAGYGLKVWDSNGTLQLDTSTRVGKLLGQITVSTSGSITNASFALGTPFFVAMPAGSQSPSYYAPITVTFSGTTMSYTVSGVSQTIFYGIY